MRVLKFGGTSVGSPEALRRADGIVRAELATGGLVVVSALSGTTDTILNAIQSAAKGDLESARQQQVKLRQRHLAVAQELGLLEVVEPAWTPLLQRLEGLLEGMGLLWEASPRARDAALAVGETLSAHLVAALLGGTFRDVRSVMRTDGRHGSARPDLAALRVTSEAWRQEIRAGALIVTQGFLGSGPDGATTTLGRGGSDTSATLLGEALRAEEVQIWPAGGGVSRPDPSRVGEARPLTVMSLREAAALSAFGAKVLHSDCLAPVARSGLRLVVGNTHRPQASRTEIVREAPPRRPGEITSVAYKEGLSLLRFPGHAPLEDVLQAALDLEEAGAVRYGLLNAPDGSLLAVRPETPAATACLDALVNAGAQREDGWAVVALVGEGLREDPAAAIRILAVLGHEPVGGLLTSNSSISVAFLVPEGRLGQLVPRIYARCIASDPRADLAAAWEPLDLCLLGVGLVGRQVLVQLRLLGERLPGQAARIRLTAVANSKRMLLEPGGLDPATALETLQLQGDPLDLERLKRWAKASGAKHPVLVDCTSSEAVAEQYEAFVEAGFHLVSASKKANSGPLSAYRSLREALARRGRCFQYETNVGAGLPILGPLRDLRNGGDQILSLEGILSGSLSCLYGMLEDGVPLSEAIGKARDAGFTEPDPRDDLSGLDVARKALILNREMGGDLELRQVEVAGVLPSSFDQSGSVESFLERLKTLDEPFAQNLQALRREGKVLRFVARVESEGARVGPVALALGHPLIAIKGGENALSYTTEAYQPRPVLVRGYGAGAAVTAAGVLADVLKVAVEVRA